MTSCYSYANRQVPRWGIWGVAKHPLFGYCACGFGCTQQSSRELGTLELFESSLKVSRVVLVPEVGKIGHCCRLERKKPPLPWPFSLCTSYKLKGLTGRGLLVVRQSSQLKQGLSCVGLWFGS